VTLALGTQAFAGGQDHIVGGETVRAGDPLASSTVLIVGQIGPKQQYICTGSLIARDTIVTAAHCVAEDLSAPVDPKNIVLIFGLSVPTSAAEAQRTPMTHISGYKYAPGWKGAASGKEEGTDTHDIAVIHFAGELPSGYAPATIINQSVPFAAGDDVTLAGYGIDTTVKSPSNPTQGAGILRKVSGVAMKGAISQAGTEMLVERKTGVSCQGDSGGPAFIESRGKDYLWGVTSRGDAKCEMGIYTFIPAYADFINQAESSLRSGNGGGNADFGMSASENGFDRQNEMSAMALRTAGAMGAALSAE
jgi:secreted trypsin-like serine protease